MFDTAKQKVTEFALEKAIRYLHRDPEKNFMTTLDYLHHVALKPYHKRWVALFKDFCRRNPQVLMQAKRLLKNEELLFNLINSWVVKGGFYGKPKREKAAAELGVSVPAAILIDPTSACNLRCKGCWAGEYSKSDMLEPELLNRIIAEAREIGIHWIVLSGGEPFCYPYLMDILEENADSFFVAFTNGTLIDEKKADQLAERANLSPAFSLEGWRDHTDDRRGAGTFDRVMKAMDLLMERGVFFGTSVTAMSNNVKELFSDLFMDFLIKKGVLYTWAFHYIPIGRNPDVQMMLSPEQRLWMNRRVGELRRNRPLFILDFWNDGQYTEGCIAGGRQYFHINAAGEVEPCAFVHFAVDNIREKSLKEVLQNSLFKAYQREQPFNDNHLAPCPIIDAPDSLCRMVAECGAHATHAGAEHVLEEEVNQYLHDLSSRWKALIDA